MIFLLAVQQKSIAYPSLINLILGLELELWFVEETASMADEKDKSRNYNKMRSQDKLSVN